MWNVIYESLNDFTTDNRASLHRVGIPAQGAAAAGIHEQFMHARRLAEDALNTVNLGARSPDKDHKIILTGDHDHLTVSITHRAPEPGSVKAMLEERARRTRAQSEEAIRQAELRGGLKP